MKKFFYLVLVFLFLTACSNNNDNNIDCNNISSEEAHVFCQMEKNCQNPESENEENNCWLSISTIGDEETCQKYFKDSESLEKCYMAATAIMQSQKYTDDIFKTKLDLCEKTNNIKSCKNNYYLSRSGYEIKIKNSKEALNFCSMIKENKKNADDCIASFYMGTCDNIKHECKENNTENKCEKYINCFIEAAKVTQNERFCSDLQYELAMRVRWQKQVSDKSYYYIPMEKINECNKQLNDS